MKLTRRKAIVGGVLGAGFVGVGWWFAHERERLGDRTLLHVKPGEAGLNGWVKIARNDTVVVAEPIALAGKPETDTQQAATGDAADDRHAPGPLLHGAPASSAAARCTARRIAL